MLTLADPLEHARRLHGSRLAVRDGERRISYAELHRRCERLASGLADVGVRPGDRVAILAANGHRYVESFFGIPAFGATVVPLNTRLAERELEAILTDSGARVLLTDRDPGKLSRNVDRVVSLPDDYEALISSRGPAATPCRDERAVAALFYTGGTTGTPKGVVTTHRNLVANAFHKTVACSLSEEDRFLAIAAMFHVAGVAPLVGLAWLGGSVVTLPSFDPERTLDAIERERITVMMPVPTMLAALAASQGRTPRDVSSLRMVGHAGSAITHAEIIAAHTAFPGAELAQFYGATETASIVTCFRHEERAIGTPLLGSCGRAVAGVAVKIARDDGTECETGEVGELLVRGPNVTPGYWNDERATAEALQDGWYRSGDLGFAKPDGWVFVVDRKKDLIISGGENVYSVEVENALTRHPLVLEAAVIGVPDPKWGEAVFAVVVLREDPKDESAVVAELIAHARTFIAGYKVPKRIVLQREPLPKSGPGKISKRTLRERFANAGERINGTGTPS